MKLILRVLIGAIALILVAQFLPGVSVDSFGTAVVAALILGLLNAIVKPILVILTLPITIVTLGLFIFVINAFLFMFAASFLSGFHVDSFLSALIGSILVSLISSIGHRVLP